jgi:regulator of protease activity HflC (stomatin/prohibitin superfamily)
MLIAILGIIALIIGMVMKRSPEPANRFARIVTNVGVVIIVLGLITACYKQVEPGEVGVQTLFGKVQSDVLESGPHFINPLVNVTTFSVQTQNYTMSAKSNEGQVEGDDAIRVLSSDGLEVTIDLSILYRVTASKAPYILQNIGQDYQDKIVRPETRTAIRDNAVAYAAVDLYSTKRQEFQYKINKTISESFEKNGLDSTDTGA